MYRNFLSQYARPLRWGWMVPAVAGFSLIVVTNVIADDEGNNNVVVVEEDWELVVKEPDEETQSPQVTCIIAPNNDDVGYFAAFNLNHKSFPQYDAGGLHLQLWHGDTPLETAQFPSDALLKTNNETVTWTLRMYLSEGRLWFEVPAGTSSTWGDFGGTGTLKASVATDLTNLNGYSTSDSVSSSGVGFAGNRVASLKLKSVRKALKSGDIVEENETRTVFPVD